MAVELPYEIAEIVLYYVPDRATLLNCALISSVWVDVSRAAAFRQPDDPISITNEWRTDPLLLPLLLQSPRCTINNHLSHILVSPKDTDWSLYLLHQLCSALIESSVRLVGISVYFDDSKPSPIAIDIHPTLLRLILHSKATLRRLHLSPVPPMRHLTIFEVVSQLEVLESIIIDGQITMEPLLDDDSIRPRPPQSLTWIVVKDLPYGETKPRPLSTFLKWLSNPQYALNIETIELDIQSAAYGREVAVIFDRLFKPPSTFATTLRHIVFTDPSMLLVDLNLRQLAKLTTVTITASSSQEPDIHDVFQTLSTASSGTLSRFTLNFLTRFGTPAQCKLLNERLSSFSEHYCNVTIDVELSFFLHSTANVMERYFPDIRSQTTRWRIWCDLEDKEGPEDEERWRSGELSLSHAGKSKLISG